MSEHVPKLDWLSDTTESNCCEDTVKLALFEIVVDIILLCGVVATANAPLMQ